MFAESQQHNWSTKATSKTSLNQDQEGNPGKDGQIASKNIQIYQS